jgi:exopolysaccharide biosynthesis polyprenyl glycosylphosphotransferase
MAVEHQAAVGATSAEHVHLGAVGVAVEDRPAPGLPKLVAVDGGLALPLGTTEERATLPTHLTLPGLLAAGDLLALTLAWLATALVLGGVGEIAPLSTPLVGVALWLAAAGGWLAVSRLLGLDHADARRADHSTADELGSLAFGVLTVTWVVGAVGVALDAPLADRFAPSFWFLGFAVCALVAVRPLARALAGRLGLGRQRALVVGAGDVGQLVARKLLTHPGYGIDLVGFVDPHPRRLAPNVADRPVHDALEDVPALVRSQRIDRVVVAFSGESDDRMAELARTLVDLGVRVDVVPRLFELVGPGATLHTMEGLPVLGLGHRRPSRAQAVLKRGVDVAVSGVLLAAMAPLFAVVALVMRRDSPGPILYRSSRVGAGGKRFEVLKFRTMHLEFCRGEGYGGASAEEAFERLMADPELRAEFEAFHKLRRDPRVTGIGHFLRRTSLDELPQLINILRGDLSLVGPRAITAEEYDMLVRNGAVPHSDGGPKPYWERDDVRPGLTGLWQVHGRSNTSFEERVLLDERYAASQSLPLDLAIMARTVRVVVSSDGAC